LPLAVKSGRAVLARFLAVGGVVQIERSGQVGTQANELHRALSPLVDLVPQHPGDTDWLRLVSKKQLATCLESRLFELKGDCNHPKGVVDKINFRRACLWYSNSQPSGLSETPA
jgi:hypothetical protein